MNGQAGDTAVESIVIGACFRKLKAFLEGLYFVYNRRELVTPDPLAFLYAYDDPLDREVAGLVASCLAYGR
ncbi:MAG: hypothetical protein LBS00_00525, partial [Synergistaceae bacterium]|nr:hypothetical protein [Synergistaceae bacterium]